MDPYAVLGVRPDASPPEVAAAYRRLAKRWHPDLHGMRAGEAESRMALINAAYEAIRRGRKRGSAPPVRREAGAGSGGGRSGGPREPGWWLDAALREALGGELVGALRDREEVVAVAGGWASSSRATLVLTDRRLLWLLDDAVAGRVRDLGLRAIVGVERRRAWPGGRTETLRVRRRGGRRLSFSGLKPEAAVMLARALEARAPAVAGAPAAGTG